MKIVYITGVIGSGKTMLEANMRYQVDLLDSTDAFPSRDGVCFIGAMYSKKLKRRVKFGGLDYGRLYTNPKALFNIIKDSSKKHEYLVMSGIISQGALMGGLEDELKNHKLYIVFNRRGPTTIQRFRKIRRSPKRKYNELTELEHIEKECKSLERQIKRWENISDIYPNVHVKDFKKSERTKERVKHLLQLIDKPMKYDRLLRKFY